jgi:hypothetical protein
MSSRSEPFDVTFRPEAPPDVPVVAPVAAITLDPEYSGQWVVMGDLDGDGVAEIISARNVDRDDVHYTSAVGAQRLDGSVLWRWGDPRVGRRELHHDVACQVHDWDGDGRNEVIVATDGFLVELDGSGGTERRRLRLPPRATDCITFANLTGNGPSDVIVKDRYWNLWAFDRDWRMLWHVENPGGYRTAHQPLCFDVDGDGRDEVMAGYALLDADGATQWVLESSVADLAAAHLDCTRVLRRGDTPADWRLVHTYCGAGCIAVSDGEGRIVWERGGHHFESLDVGHVRADAPGPQILVDLVDDVAPGLNGTWLLDAEGELLGQFATPYSRFHALVDWNADGLDEVLLADVALICDGQGRPLARLAFEDAQERFVRIGDMTGEGHNEVSFIRWRGCASTVTRPGRSLRSGPASAAGSTRRCTEAMRAGRTGVGHLQQRTRWPVRQGADGRP